MIPFAKPMITEADKKAVMNALSRQTLTHGPELEAFEKEFAEHIGGGYCVGVSSGMAALQLSCVLAGFGPGDEVIVPAMTHVATVHAVELTGARPIFVDCHLSGNMTPEDIEKKVTKKTVGIVLVHFIGIPCKMPEIMSFAKERRLHVIEDCALALGTKVAGKHVGLWGNCGAFSFYPTKHITTGEGGMFVTKYKAFADKARLLRGFGVKRYSYNNYNVPRLGYNFRMSEVTAALGRSQLKRADKYLSIRLKNSDYLEKLLYQYGTNKGSYCFMLFSGKRDRIAQELRQNGIGTSIYYPHPVPRLTYYLKKYGYKRGDYPNAEEIADYSIAIPIGPHVTKENLEQIARIIKNGEHHR